MIVGEVRRGLTVALRTPPRSRALPARREVPTLVAIDEGVIDRALDQALELGEIGVQVAVYLGDELVVDAWKGVADQASGRSVDADTLFPVFSVTKAITATALHLQAERGLVEYDAPVARYWPEFGRNGKEQMTVRHVLSHRSGIPQMPDSVTPELMCDWDWMVGQIASYTPYFVPGTKSGYQSLVFGWTIGEVVRRTDPAGRDFGRFIREEICEPLGADDLWLGLPDGELSRAAVLYGEVPDPPDPRSDMSRAAMPTAVAPVAAVHNRMDVRKACLPGAGGIMSARSAARVFAMLANGGVLESVRLLPESRLRDCTAPRENAQDLDLVLYGGNRFAPPIGNGGYWYGHGLLGTGPGIVCHSGAGGSVGWADLDTRLSIVICHNRMFEFQTTSSDLTGHPFLPFKQALQKLLPDVYRG